MRHKELSEPVRQSLRNARVCWLASSSNEGEPCLAPKVVFTAEENRVLLADVPDSECIGNVRMNPRICLCFLDMTRDAGFKIFATGRVFDHSDPGYAELRSLLQPDMDTDTPVTSIIEATTYDHVAMPFPVLQTHPHRTRGEMMEEHFQTYTQTPPEL